jgi:hypothetical protein
MNYKELSRVGDSTTKVKDSDNTFESEMEALTNELYEKGKGKYPEHWTEDQRRAFDKAFEDYQLEYSSEDFKLRPAGEYVYLDLKEMGDFED